MKKTCLMLCALFVVLIPALAAAQDVAGLEYFIDSDPGVGAGTWVNVTSAAEIEKSFTVDVAALSPGLHLLFVRAVDSDGVWGLPVMRPFLKQTLAIDASDSIAAAEYFIDSDPGVGNATSISIDPGAEVTLDFAADLGSLNDGLHVFQVRIRDGRGAWSLVVLKPIYVEHLSLESPGDVAQAEFFIDDDPGFGSGTAIAVSPGLEADLVFNVDLSGLSEGLHLLHVRTADAEGRWSLVTLKPFLAETISLDTLQHIVRAEYFLDDDPGFGGGTAIDLTEGEWADIQFVADLDTLSEGLHLLHVRSMDALGHWSEVAMKPFRLETALASEPPGDIVLFEWVFRTSTTATDTIPFTDFEQGPDLDLEYEADLSALNPFTAYDYYLHLIDDRGAQSLHYVHPFTMQPSPESFALLSPVDNDTVWTGDTTLVWQNTVDPDTADSIVHFDVWLDTLSDLSTAVLVADSIADTSLAIDSLLDDHTYWWAVRATDSNTSGSWSRNLGQFNVYIPQPPEAFVLLAPDSGRVFPDIAEFPFVFHWNAPYDPDPGDTVLSTLEISTSEEFTDPTLYAAGLADSFAVPELAIGQYWWRVHSWDMFGFEVYSLQTWPINVTLPVEERDATLPEQYEITALYPNPFNPVLTVVIGLPEPAFLKLDVYNVLGRHVAQLAGEVRDAGYHRYQLSSNRLASGVYVVRAEVPGKMNEVMRVVLLR